jgi:hypothetical protein
MYIQRKNRVGTQRCSEEAAAPLSLPSFLPVSTSRLLPRSLHLLLVYTELLEIQ